MEFDKGIWKELLRSGGVSSEKIVSGDTGRGGLLLVRILRSLCRIRIRRPEKWEIHSADCASSRPKKLAIVNGKFEDINSREGRRANRTNRLSFEIC